MPTFTFNLDSELLRIAVERGEPIEINLVVSPTSGLPVAGSTAAPASGPLAALMSGGLLEPGERLVMSQRRANRSATATLRADGGMDVDGKTGVFWSPSRAAAAITGSQINGWNIWRKEADGRTLDELRTTLDSRDGGV